LIQSVKLTHFQSHENTLINLHPGVNSIIGSSNSGKTSVLRGLLWVIYNRPSGQAFISHWNQTKKGVPIESTEVAVTLENDTIIRGRDKDFNGYRINDKKPLEAIRMDVPEIVSSLFNLGEVNIQKQMDAPFLLSESAGEVARFFNREIRLDLIDRILSAAERVRRTTNNLIERSTAQITKLEAELAELDWLDIADKIVTKAEKVNLGVGAGKAQIDILTGTVHSFSENLHKIEDNDLIISAQPLILSIDKQMADIASEEESAEELSNWIDSYKRCQQNIVDLPDIETSEKLAYKINNLSVGIKADKAYIHAFQNLIIQYEDHQEGIKICERELKKAYKSLPEICPLCGSELI